MRHKLYFFFLCALMCDSYFLIVIILYFIALLLWIKWNSCKGNSRKNWIYVCVKRGICLEKISRVRINMTCRNLIPKSFKQPRRQWRIIVYFRIADESPACDCVSEFEWQMFIATSSKNNFWTRLFLSFSPLSFCPSGASVFVLLVQHSHTHSKFTSRIDASIYLYDLSTCVGDVW